MSALNSPIGAEGPAPDPATARRAVGLASLLTLAVGLGFALYEYPPPSLGLVMAGGLAATGVLALALARFDAAIALGLVLLAVVNVEPAPPDLVFMAVIAVAAVTGRFDIGRVPKIAAVAVGAFLCINVLSLVQAIDPYRASFFVAVTLYLAVFSLWFASYLDSERKARIVVCAYLLAAVLSAGLGVAALYVPFPGSQELLYDPSRVEGLFKDPNVFGPFLVPIALILLEEMLRSRLLRMGLVLKSLFLLILAIGIVFSFSRAAWLNFAVGIAVVTVITVLRSGGARRSVALITVLAAGGLTAATVIGATGENDFIAQRASIQRYDAERFGAQEQGLELAASRPLGIGPGQFDVISPVAAHSTYVRVLTEEGFPGVLAFLTLITATLVLGLRNATLGRDTYGIGSAALLGAWLGILANSFFVDTLHWRHLWLVAALIWAGTMRGRLPGGRGAQPG